jgi:hypothetical protein
MSHSWVSHFYLNEGGHKEGEVAFDVRGFAAWPVSVKP